MQSVLSSSFDIFSEIQSDKSIQSYKEVELLPLSGSTNSSTIEFEVHVEETHYIDLANTNLHIKIKIERTDGKPLTSDGEINLIPSWPSALFSQVDMFINGKCITTSTGLYGYKSHLQSLLSYPKAVKKDQLSGLEKFEGSSVPKNGILEALVPLNLDLHQQNRFLIDLVRVYYRLTRSKNDFILLTTNESSTGVSYNVKIEHISMFLTKIIPSESQLSTHASSLLRRNALYPISRIFMKSWNLAQGKKHEVIPNLFHDILPTRIFCGFISSRAFNGDSKENPFHFEPKNLNEIYLVVNGSQLPFRSYEPSFTDSQCTRLYHNLLQTCLGQDMDIRSLGISLKDFISGGSSIFAFSLHPSSLNQELLAPTNSGTINLHLGFESALTENTTIVILSEYQNSISIDSARNIYTDFN